MPSEIVCEIFLCIHAGSEGDLRAICLTCKAWYNFAIDLPFLWHHLHRKAAQTCNKPMLSRLQRTKQIPLHLRFDIAHSEDEQDISSFLHIASANAHRWRCIDIECPDFALADALLDFTRRQALPGLECLIISDNPPFLTPPAPQLLLARAPLLCTLAVSSGNLGCFSPTRTLVDIHLRPCYGTIGMLQTLSLSRVETLYLGTGLWDLFRSSSLVEFPFMRQLTIEGIPWATFQVLLGILNAPLLFTLAVLVELNAYPHDMYIKDSLDRPAHVSLVSDFTLTIRHEPMLNERHMSAVVFTCGWKLPNITRFTTNITFQFLDAFCTIGPSLLLDNRCYGHGFTLGNELELAVPSFAYSRLQHLRIADPWLHTHEIARILTFSFENGLALKSMTVCRNPFSDAKWAELGSLVDIYVWGVQLDIDLASTALFLIQ